MEYSYTSIVYRLTRFFVSALLLTSVVTAAGQTVAEELLADPNRAAGYFYGLPVGKVPKDTPAPEGKKPYYINRYGCPSSYYRESSDLYEAPCATFAKADSLGKLTKLGQDVKRRLDLIRRDAQGRTGELTAKGAQQSRELMRQLVMRFPDVFISDVYCSGRSIVQNNCLMTVEEALLQLSTMIQPFESSLSSSHRADWYMDPRDKKLEEQCWDSLTLAHYNRFLSLNTGNARLMELLFNDQNFLIQTVDPETLSRQLIVLAGSIQHTDLSGSVKLFDLFTPVEIMSHWKKLNARNYIQNGACSLNGGTQPFIQRSTLRSMIHMGDSLQTSPTPIVHLRYTTENVVMALACLMELDNCGLQTDDLNALGDMGWVNYRIAPLGGSIMMVFYRHDPDDPDKLVKVLLNGQEARLPIESDCAPYYHWNDVKRYYLRKLYRYENTRLNEEANK
ncbi:MAG: histidine-type phosphatase [Prevotella sp.]|nr:histidine-type phosphatase [Prevotella sp.]